jgi:hypothetical protein
MVTMFLGMRELAFCSKLSIFKTLS